MKTNGKKEIKTKVKNAINLVLFELQLIPSGGLKKSLSDVSKKIASAIKQEIKTQLKQEKKKASSKDKTRTKKVSKKVRQHQVE